MIELTEKTYANKLKDPRWQRRRLEIMQRDNFACRYCGDAINTLQVHHLKYEGDPWDAPSECLITLCEKHHDKLHNFEKIEVVSEGFRSPYDFIALYPLLVNMSLRYIENSNGVWVIQFRENISPDQIVHLVCLLYRFISPIDCDIRIRVDGKKDIDVYRFLNDLTIPLE